MKKFTSILFAALALLASSCSKTQNATPSATDAQQGEPFESTISIRYVNTDSIGQYYLYAQEVKTQLEKIALELQQKENAFQRQIQQKAATIDQKTQNNQYMTQQSFDLDMQELNKLQNYAQQQLQAAHEKAAQEAAVLQSALNDSISNFLIEFNADKQYDAILDRQVGLYFNPALDITKEVIDGLNARYIPSK